MHPVTPWPSAEAAVPLTWVGWILLPSKSILSKILLSTQVLQLYGCVRSFDTAQSHRHWHIVNSAISSCVPSSACSNLEVHIPQRVATSIMPSQAQDGYCIGLWTLQRGVDDRSLCQIAPSYGKRRSKAQKRSEICAKIYKKRLSRLVPHCSRRDEKKQRRLRGSPADH